MPGVELADAMAALHTVGLPAAAGCADPAATTRFAALVEIGTMATSTAGSRITGAMRITAAPIMAVPITAPIMVGLITAAGQEGPGAPLASRSGLRRRLPLHEAIILTIPTTTPRHTD